MEHRTSNIIVCVFDEASNKWSVRKIDDYKSSDNFTAIILTEPYTTKQEEISINLPNDTSDKDIIDVVSMRLQEHLGQRFPANASFEMFQEHIVRTSVLCCKLSTLTMAFLLPFLPLSAETEIINGIEWSYYVKDGYAVLESPLLGRLRAGESSTGGSSPAPTHIGQLPACLELPSSLGGVPVRRIGTAAIQLQEEDGVHAIIIPETVQEMTHVSLCGPLNKKEYSNYYYSYYYSDVYFAGVTNVFFKGNKPEFVIDMNDWRDGRYHVSCNCSVGTGVTTWVVEGAQGWNVNAGNLWYLYPQSSSYCRTLKYGAASVQIFVDGIVCTNEYRFNDFNDKVSLSCSNNTAVIYYTTDGSEPSSRSTIYCEPIPAGKCTLKAIAVVPEYPYTITKTCEFQFADDYIPTINSEQAPFNWAGNLITLFSVVEGAEIRYTLDGSEPTENSNLYTGPFTIDDTTTVKAKAFKEDWFESETATTTFTREWYTVVTPVIEPDETTFENVSQTISLSCVTEGATILYTTDGSNPKTNGREYKNPFTIYDSCTIRAIAVKYDWKDSEEITATFTRTEGLSEAVNLYGYLMETDTSNPWTVVTDVSHDGVSCVRSGAIGHGGTTWLQTSMRKAGTVSFWWKAACEEAEEEGGETYWYDYGSFLVDGVEKAKIAGNDTGWRKVEVDVPTGGKHVLRWEYRKDGATSYSPDCIWLDQVQWIPADGSGYTLTTPDPVPYSWLSGYGLGLDSDFESAAKQSFGKTDSNGRAMQVWQDYVAGTDPTNTMDFLRAVISFSNGMPQVSWTPNLNSNSEMRVYTVLGKTNLTDAAWMCPTNSGHRFFKVKVELP